MVIHPSIHPSKRLVILCIGCFIFLTHLIHQPNHWDHDMTYWISDQWIHLCNAKRFLFGEENNRIMCGFGNIALFVDLTKTLFWNLGKWKKRTICMPIWILTSQNNVPNLCWTNLTKASNIISLENNQTIRYIASNLIIWVTLPGNKIQCVKIYCHESILTREFD